MLETLRQAFDLVAREHRGRWLLLVGLALLVSGLEMVGAVLVYSLLALVVDPGGDIELPLVGDVRERFTGLQPDTVLLGLVVAMAIFFLVRAVARISSTYLQARVAHNAGARLSNRLVEGYLRWPYAAHLQRNSSELIRNGHQAVIELVGGVVLPVVRIGAESLLLLGMLAVLTVVAPMATALAVVVVGGAAVLLLVVVQPRLKRIGEVNHREASATLGALQQALHGVRDIKVLGRERYFARVYGASRLRMARARYLHDTAWQLPSTVIETALLGFILLFFAIAIVRGGRAEETLSVLGLFAYVGMRLQPSLRDIVAGLNSLKYSAAPLRDLHADLLAVEAVPVDEPGTKALGFSGIIDVSNVSFKYEESDQAAIREVSLKVGRGEQVGICGPTGGGKTTLVDLMAGLLEPTDGEVLVDGVDIHANARAWQRNLGIVPQMVFLIDDTLRRNIALGVPDSQIDEAAVVEATRLAQLDEFIDTLPGGLDSKIGERGIRISGGQRQRIAIARALYTRPAVLIFDEGTSALDNATESLLMEAIDRLRGDHTIILIAHRLSTVRKADKVVFLENGRVAGIGTYAELIHDSQRFRAMADAL